jgi:hypothetical protein
MKMEPIECSESSASNTQTPGIYPKESELHFQHGKKLKLKIKFQGYSRKDGAQLFCRYSFCCFMGILYYSIYIFILCLCNFILIYVLFYIILCLFVCKCVQTTATGCLSNYSRQIYQYQLSPKHVSGFFTPIIRSFTAYGVLSCCGCSGWRVSWQAVCTPHSTLHLTRLFLQLEIFKIMFRKSKQSIYLQ